MKITMKATKLFVQLSSNDALFSSIWFIRVKTVEEANAEGVYYFGPMKKIHKGFFLAMLINQ